MLRISLSLSIALMLASSAQAAPGPLRYLPDSAVRERQVLDTPPASGSAGNTADLERILALQSSRDPKECARAAAESHVTLRTFFGGQLNEAELGRWSDFFERIRAETDFFVQRAKKIWARPRPYMADPRVKPCITLEKTMAYPSGHAAISRVFARVLSEMVPAQADAFMNRANEIAAHRVMGGVHHPTDIEAGKKLGDRVYEALMASPRFLKELRAQER